MRDRFRFLHAADLHLDSPLRGLVRYEGLALDEIRSATRRALDNLITFATEERVDFVVIAGDVYDGKWQDMGTGLYFHSAMARLKAASIPVYLLRGNHDAESVITKSLPKMDSVEVFPSRKADSFVLEEHGVVLHGRSFPSIHVTEDMTPSYPSAREGYFNIGVLHTSLGGYSEHETYAPCSIPTLAAKGYDYWALGHVHDFAVLSQDPWIVYPGVLQGRKINEAGIKGAVLVEVEDRAVRSVRQVPLDVVRWARTAVDCTGLESRDELYGLIRKEFQQLASTHADGRSLVVRVRLEGSSTLHEALLDSSQSLRDDLRAIASEVDSRLWIEKIALHTEPLASGIAIDAAADDNDGAGDLLSLLDEAANNPDMVAELQRALTPFLTVTPAPLQEADDEDSLNRMARRGEWPAFLDSVTTALRARLLGEATS